jgi:hypothetical protein
MHPDDLHALPPEKLVHLLTATPASEWPASPADLAAILRHQLAAPLLPDLVSVPGAEAARLEALLHDRPFTQHFLAQLTAIAPSLELLEAIKNFARHANDTPDHPLRGTPATILYYAAIAAAFFRCNARISQLSEAALREAFGWAAEQPAAGALRSLFVLASSPSMGGDG